MSLRKIISKNEVIISISTEMKNNVAVRVLKSENKDTKKKEVSCTIGFKLNPSSYDRVSSEVPMDADELEQSLKDKYPKHCFINKDVLKLHEDKIGSIISSDPDAFFESLLIDKVFDMSTPYSDKKEVEKAFLNQNPAPPQDAEQAIKTIVTYLAVDKGLKDKDKSALERIYLEMYKLLSE